MWEIDRFRRKEDGALLVFFAICAAGIFLIAALSFDIGRRASTQSDLQSFADNVALAAAGELNGLPGAMSRARRAADELISDTTRFSRTSDENDLGGLSDFELTFFRTLPNDESSWAAPLAFDVAAVLNPNDTLARFVRIEVNPVDVEWQFANLLGIFSSDPLPDEAVAAEATAGYTTIVCDVAPVFFCLPPAQPEDAAQGSPIWDPANHLGSTVLLRAGGGGGGPNAWRPGSFGYLDVLGSGAQDAKTDPVSPCFGIGDPTELYECLLASVSPGTMCFENGGLGLRAARGSGIASAALNTKFDIYDALLSGLQGDDRFRPAPVVTKQHGEGDTCSPGGSGAPDTSSLTDDFPGDDCFTAGPPYSGCERFGGGGNPPRVGNGDWSQGRLAYVDANYSLDLASVNTVLPTEVVDGYHLDDPFRPAVTGHPRKAEYIGYPVVSNGAWRWNYYNAEVAAAQYANPAVAYDAALGEVDVTEALSVTPTDLIRSFEDIDGNVIGVRPGTSLPHCAADSSIDPRRRTLVAAVVDCGANAAVLSGGAGATGTATWFVELFLPGVVGDISGVPSVGADDFYVEVISGGLQDGAPTFASGAYRNLVQLYR